ncbi:hypothetical protein [Planctomicrobium piriforme]|uniref:Uncharacterized protein n=1 Tax=Planctomicrobium piriforme TaxID=1576369 RepID=A0A1I3C0H0_9PLAN|nr:hypothetical protein [Planctomicrobium piriforme]SFH67471.1 hypothetical protein SAMN05421753_1026 [Planctomicrobium piriforme]
MAVTEQTQPESVASANYVDFDEFIEFQLKKTRSGIHQADLMSAVVVLCAALTGYLLLFAVFDQWVLPGGFSPATRLALIVLIAAASLSWIGWKVVWPWWRQINSLYAARQIEKTHPEFKSSLMTWVDFQQSGREIPPGIRSALERRTAQQISQTNVEEAIDRRLLMRASYILLGLVVAICLYTLISPKRMSTTLWRALMPLSSVAAATRTEIRDVKPGDTEVLARDQIDVSVELGGHIPEEVTLLFSTVDRRFVNEPLKMRRTEEQLPSFQTRLTGDAGKGLLSDVSYHITAGDATSKTYQIRVNQPPSAEVAQIIYEYPQYMGLGRSEQQSNIIDAWEGTWVTVRARPNMPVKQAIVYCSDQETTQESAEAYPMQIRDDLLTARWQLKFRDDGTFARYFHVQVWNERNQKDPQPTVYRIKIRPDLKPEISVVHPDRDMTVPANATVPIAVSARDPDFLLRRVVLKLQLNGDDLPLPALFTAPPEMAEFQTIHRLDLAKYSVKAGDHITLFAEAEDNFEPFGKRQKNISRTQRITLTIAAPAAPEQNRQFNDQQAEELQNRLPQADEPNRPRQENPQPNQPQEPQQPGLQREPRQQPPEQKQLPMQPGQEMPADKQAANENEPGQEPKGNPQQQRPQGEQGEKPPQGAGQDSSGQGKQTQGQQSQGQQGEGKPSGDQKESGNSSQQNGQQQPSGNKQNGQQPSGNNGQGKAPPGKQDSSNKNANTPPQNQAGEDQALQRLLDWNKEQEKQNQNSQPQNDSSKPQQGGNPPAQQPKSEQDSTRQNEMRENGDSKTTPPQQKQDSSSQQKQGEQQSKADKQSGDSKPENRSGQKSPAGNDPMQGSGQDQQSAGQENKSNSMPDQKSGQQSPSAPQKGENSPQQTGQQQNTGDNSSPGEKSGQKSEPQQSGSKPSGEQNSGEKQPSNSAAGDQSSPAMQKGDKGEANSPSDASPSGQSNGDNKPGEAKSDSNSSGKPDSMKPGEQSQNATPKKGDPQSPAGEKNNPGSPDSDAMPGDKGAAPEKSATPPKQGKPAGSEPQNADQNTPPAQGEPKQGQRGKNDPANQQSAPDAGSQGEPMPGQKSEQNASGDKKAGGEPREAGQPNQDQMPKDQQQQSGDAGQQSGQQGGDKGQQKSGQQGQPKPGQPQDDASGQQPSDSKPNQQNGGQQQMKQDAGGKESPQQNGQQQQSGQEQPGQKPGGQQPQQQGQNAPQENSSKPQNGQPQQGGKQESGEQQGGKQNGSKQEGGKQEGSQQGGQQKGKDGQQPGEKGEGGQSGGQQPGEQPGQPGGQQSGGKPGQGQHPGGAPQQGDMPAGGQPGNSPQESGGKPGGEANGQGGKGNNRGRDAGDGGDGGANDLLTPEAADLANRKKATELALKRLRQQLDRGQAPEDLLRELGYSEQDLERFMQRLEERLADPGLDKSAETDAARRQFESLLKGIQYDSTGQNRSGGERERKATQSSGSGNRPVPPEYRRDTEAYKQKLSK